jgi:hypothetical protein
MRSVRWILAGLLFLNTSWIAAADVIVSQPSETDLEAYTDKIELSPSTTIFQIEAVRDVSSGTAKEGDYVEFKVLENVSVQRVVTKDGKQQLATTPLIAKDTVVLGVVTKSHHRRFPFRNGSLYVEVRYVKGVDGTPIPVLISRPLPQPAKNKGVVKMATFDADNIRQMAGEENSRIKGRKNATVAPLVPAVAIAGATYFKDKTARNVAVLTLFSQAGVGELLNGTDAKITAGEIFDVVVDASKNIAIRVPKESDSAEAPTAPAPAPAPSSATPAPD